MSHDPIWAILLAEFAKSHQHQDRMIFYTFNEAFISIHIGQIQILDEFFLSLPSFHKHINPHIHSAHINTLRPRQNGRRFADDIFKRIFLNGNIIISIKISLKFVPEGPIDNNPALVLIMAWRRSGDKPLSEPMMVTLLTHLCVTRPQWVKTHINTLCMS